MRPRRTAVQRICAAVNAVLWAALCAFTVLVIAGLPRMIEARHLAEDQRARDIAAENKAYCEKWGMRAGSREFMGCMLDLQDIRAEDEQRIAGDLGGFP